MRFQCTPPNVSFNTKVRYLAALRYQESYHLSVMPGTIWEVITIDSKMGLWAISAFMTGSEAHGKFQISMMGQGNQSEREIIRS